MEKNSVKRKRRKKRRRLRQPFRFIRNVFLFLIVVFLIFYGIYKIFIEKEINALAEVYEQTIYDSENKVEDIDMLNEPYTIALIGYDNVEGARHADSLNIAYVNPQINQIKFLNIPRDAYINYECIDNKSDKITNAMAYGGVDCVIDGIENLLDIEIDFYVSSNFDGIVRVVDALGGIQTDVPDYLDGQVWCEQATDPSVQICFDKFGQQTIDGQQALAIARSRKYSSDLHRGDMQTQVVKDVILTAVNNVDLEVYKSVLRAIETDIKSNISANQMVDMGYNFFLLNKEGNEIERLQVPGVADYGNGEYVGWGSYFWVDNEELDIIKNDLNEFMNTKNEDKSFIRNMFEKFILED